MPNLKNWSSSGWVLDRATPSAHSRAARGLSATHSASYSGPALNSPHRSSAHTRRRSVGEPYARSASEQGSRRLPRRRREHAQSSCRLSRRTRPVRHRLRPPISQSQQCHTQHVFFSYEPQLRLLISDYTRRSVCVFRCVCVCVTEQLGAERVFACDNNPLVLSLLREAAAYASVESRIDCLNFDLFGKQPLPQCDVRTNEMIHERILTLPHFVRFWPPHSA